MALKISTAVRNKLQERHNVNHSEILECFLNRTHCDLIDTREEHQTEPPTKWFISQTDMGRSLKICYIQRGGDLEIKTVYEPENPSVKEMYYRKATEC